MIVAGFGFRSGAKLSSLRDALALAIHGMPPVTHLATVPDKMPLLFVLARALDLPVASVSADALAQATTLTNSTASMVARRTGSVAEASALVAAGPGARLLVPRSISSDHMATCAIAQGVLI